MNPSTIYIWGCFHYPGHRLWSADGQPITHLRALEPFCDYMPTPSGEQVEGVIHGTNTPGGWSYVVWWDRQGDPRGGSHTGILAEGNWTAEQLLLAAHKLAPWVLRVEPRRAP